MHCESYRRPSSLPRRDFARGARGVLERTWQRERSRKRARAAAAADDTGSAANQVLGAAEHLASPSTDLAGQVNRFLSEVRSA